MGSGGLLQVGVADVGTLVTTSTNNPIGTNVFMPFTEVVFRVGAYFRQGHSLSLGIGLSYLSVSQGGNDTTLLNVTFAPTYRYHFLPLRPWQLSPFAQLELIVSVNNQSFSSPQPNVTVVPFGVSAGVGAEYLLGDRFGLVIVAGGRFTTVTSGATPGVSNTGTTVNTFQAWGSAAVSLHF